MFMTDMDLLYSSAKMTEFSLNLFKRLYKIDKLNAISPYLEKCESKYKILIKYPQRIELKGLFLESTEEGIKQENAKTVNGRSVARWFDTPFLINGKMYFLSNQWSHDDRGKANPSFCELKNVIGFCYPDYYIEKKNNLYCLLKLNKQLENKMAVKSFDVNRIVAEIKTTKLIYSDGLIQRYVYALLTKPFVILSGLAGSGKTQLALTFAKAMVEDEEKQMCVVSVGSDWTNREPLLGYPNALNNTSYIKPENGVLDLLIESNKPENSSKPYFLILDEMNLSYVERYFADFLSAMESHVNIPLWKGSKDDVPQSVSLPKNLFIIGTINVDETTYMFSPKVLDRASVIEFKVSEEDMENFLSFAPVVDMSKVNGTAADMAADFVNIASKSIEISVETNEVLKVFFKQLKTVNAEFGYRTATEFGRFVTLSKDVLGDSDAVDAAIVQKLLPKLHGSRKKIVPVLKELWKLCGTTKDLEVQDISNKLPDDIIYKLTADKIFRMYRCAIDNGFTSFAEA